MKQAITSTNPIKAKVMKTFKDKFNATKITSVVYDNKAKIYTANCFRKFVYLGNNEISESEIKEINK
jgi:hypothetical protein